MVAEPTGPGGTTATESDAAAERAVQRVAGVTAARMEEERRLRTEAKLDALGNDVAVLRDRSAREEQALERLGSLLASLDRRIGTYCEELPRTYVPREQITALLTERDERLDKAEARLDEMQQHLMRSGWKIVGIVAAALLSLGGELLVHADLLKTLVGGGS